MNFIFHLFNPNYIHPSVKHNDPARVVPLGLRARMLFATSAFWGGVFFLGIGVTFCWMFLSLTDFASLSFGKELVKTEASLTEITDTRYYENNKHFYGYRYTYEVNGKKYPGISYSTRKEIKPGAKLSIEYERATPAVSRAEGMRMAPAGLYTLLVLLLPVIGVGIILMGMRDTFMKVIFLRHGITANAFVESIKNYKSKSYYVHVAYKTNGGKDVKAVICIRINRVNNNKNGIRHSELPAGKEASVLYLPWEENKASLVNSFNAKARAIL